MNDFIKFTVSLSIIVLLATAGLAKVFLLTKDVISEQKQKKINSALEAVLITAEKFELHTAPAPVDSFWTGKDATGALVGFAFIGSANGYSSEIQCMVGIDLKGIIQRVFVLDQKETPGLGTRTEEIASSATIWNPGKGDSSPQIPWFQEQFSGLSLNKPLTIKRGPEWHVLSQEQKQSLLENNSICALTGATISTDAVLRTVSGKGIALLKEYQKNNEGEIIQNEQKPEQ
jgi:electron transport complex protein RnfG